MNDIKGVAKESIYRTVYSHRPDIRECYDAALKRNPNTRGKIIVAFKIESDGTLFDGKIKESSLHDVLLEGCILHRMAKWRFDTAPAITEVVAYPYYLSPG